MVERDSVDLDDLARLSGESVDAIRHWRDLGLLIGADVSENVERARLIRFAERRGIPPDEVARISADQGDMLASFTRWALQSGRGSLYTRREAAERCGLDTDLVDQIWAAAGLLDQPGAYEEDLEALQLVATALKFGLPVDVLLQLLRVFADSLGRVSDAATRVFHLHVHEQFRVQGLHGAELLAATQSIADPLTGLIEPAVMYFHRKSWERANREDLLLHLREESTAPGELVRAMLFVDLSSYTPLTEAMGDAAAASVVGQFSDIVREAAAAHDGQIVKQIGDEFMLAFPTARTAVGFGIGIRARAHAQPNFPGLRIGAHCGPVLFREGDYYGATVNLAARVTSAAARDQFLITEALRGQIAGSGIDTTTVGSRSLKGISGDVELYEVEPSDRHERLIDPVCGMALDLSVGGAVHLDWEGTDVWLCSENCRDRFLDAPDRYSHTASG
ncbi:MAG: adenylate cyclase [Actinobacteria bacterium]|nr:MAG: adenylate cyclase [Actinomycetota bacterium]